MKALILFIIATWLTLTGLVLCYAHAEYIDMAFTWVARHHPLKAAALCLAVYAVGVWSMGRRLNDWRGDEN